MNLRKLRSADESLERTIHWQPHVRCSMSWMKSEVVENTQGQTRVRDMRIGAEMSSRLAARGWAFVSPPPCRKVVGVQTTCNVSWWRK